MKNSEWLKRTREAFDGSSAYLDSNYRPDWDYSLKAFRSEHASGSKYLSPEYAARSKIFRPKTRSIIRKNEAAAAAALFSNMEVVNITPGDPDNLYSVAGAAVMKEVLEYRLTKTIPAFEICIGGVQDAQKQGAVISYQYWDYKVKNGKKLKDKPCIELRPIENIRLDGGADWLDPVNSSPYFFDILPMYVCDVKSMMNSTDEKTGAPKWKKLDDKAIARAKPDTIDTTRQARLGKKEDPSDETKISAFDTVWVFRVFMRDDNGDDHTYYTLGTEELLTDPKPIDEVYHHGVRPYVMGYAILETHTAFKSPLPIIIKPLQQETNELRNQRVDNVRFVLNKRWIVARGRQVDVQSLVRNVPGGVTLATDPKNDVHESNWPDVTSSSYVEEDRINADLDDVAGNFSPSTKVANNAVNDTLGGSKLAVMGAGLMTDYLLRTIIETWWEKALRQLILLEQYYENDEIILGLCGKKARLYPRFGISQVNDDLLAQEVNLTVNVGMGSSNPNERFQKFLVTTKTAIEMVATAPPGFNVKEGIKELYSNAGYRDGARFWDEQQDPRLMKAMQTIQQLTGMLKGKQMELQAASQVEQMKLASNERVKVAQLTVDKGRIDGDLQIRQAELALEGQKLELEKVRLQLEASMMSREHELKVAELGNNVQEAHLKLEAEHQKIAGQAMKIAADIEKAQVELEKAKVERVNEAKNGEGMSKVTQSVGDIGKQISSIAASLESARSGVSGLTSEVDGIKKGLGALAGVVLTPKKKAKSFRLSKKDGKTDAVVVGFDDGTEEEMAVG